MTSNRFDAVRLAFALVVCTYHIVAVASLDPSGHLERALGQAAELSIQGFFIVSGALVYGSLQRSNDLFDYAGKRVRRLYPAYLVVILIPALVSLGLTRDWQGVMHYLAVNVLFLNFLEPNLPGLFQGNRFSEVNGALWTLKIEVMFYVALPVLAWCLRKLGGLWWLGIAAMMLVGLSWAALPELWANPIAPELARQLPGQLMFFAAGMALWQLWPIAKSQAPALLVIGGVCLALSMSVESLASLRVLGLTALIAGFAFMPGPPIQAARWGDVSYGVYIVHFPIIQSLVALGAFSAIGPFAGGGLALMLVLLVSFALWWWVEKPALRHDSHYRRASEETE